MGITAEEIADAGPFPVYGGNGLRGYTDRSTHSGTYVLVGRQGALCGNVRLASGTFWASEHAVVCDVRGAHEPRWLAYVLESLNLNQYSVSAAQPGLAVDRIRDLSVPVPPQPLQAGIADFLDRKTAAIDALIEKKERLVELIREQRHVAIWTAVTKGVAAGTRLKDAGHQWLTRVPSHWVVTRTRQVARLESGHTPSRQHPEYWVPEECTIPWVSLADVWQLREGTSEVIRDTSEKISPIGIANSAARLLPAETVVVSRTASVGFSAVIAEPMATTQDFVNFVCGARIRPLYLLYVFRAMRDEFRRLTMGSTHQTIYMPDVARFVTPVPPLEEQDAIVDHIRRTLRGIDAGATALDAQIGKLREYRQALITAAVNGQVDVSEEAA